MTKIKNFIKNFLKPSIFKIVLTLIITILPLIEGVIYNENMVHGQKINLGLKIMHYISEILYIPFKPIQSLSFELMKKYSEPNLALLFIPLFIIYFYFLSCFILLFIKKIRKFWRRIFKKNF